MIEIGTKKFRTQKEAVNFYRGILYGFDPRSVEQKTDLLELLERHPAYVEKIGAGVKNFRVGPDGYGGKCFYADRIDGSSVDFSFMTCIKAKCLSTEVMFRKACRDAVRQQIVDYRECYFAGREKAPCEATGVLLTVGESHVDHIPPLYFEYLVRDFINENQVDLQSVTVVAPDCHYYFEDESFSRSFSDYHQKRAKLRVVASGFNLRLAKPV